MNSSSLSRVAAILIGNTCLRMGSGASGVLVGLYVAQLASRGMGGGAELAGTLGAVSFATELAGSVPMGLVSDALAPRVLMTAGAILGAIATQLFGLAGRTGILFVSRSIEGLGAATSAPAILAHLTDVTGHDPAFRARVMSFFELTILGGLALGGLAGGELWSWKGKGAFAFVAIVYLFAALLLYWGGAGSRGYGASAAISGLRRAFHSPSLRRLAPVWLCANALAGLWLGPTVSFLLVEKHRGGQFLSGVFAAETFKVGWATFIFAIIFGSGITAWSFILPHMKLFDGMKIALFGMLGVCFWLYFLNHSTSDQHPWRWITGALAALFIMVESGFTPAALSMLANIVGPEAGRGAAMGIYSVMLSLGAIFGSLIAGWLGGRFSFDGIILGTVTLGGVGMVLLFRMQRQERGTLP